MSDTETTTDATTTEKSVGVPDTLTYSTESASDEFERIEKMLADKAGDTGGDEDSRSADTVDDVGEPDDSPSTTESSYDADAIRLEHARETARRFGVDSGVVDSFSSAGEAEAYLHGMRQALSQAQQAGGGQQYQQSQQQQQQQAPSLPKLDFSLSEDVDEGIRGALGKIGEYGNTVNGRLSQYEQNFELLANALIQLDRQNRRALESQQRYFVERHIDTLEPEVKELFQDPKTKKQLFDEMRTIQAGITANGGNELSDEELIRRGVAMIAYPKMREIERNRLEKAQAKKAKGVTPKPASAATPEREMDDTQRGFAKFAAEHAKLAAKFNR